MKLSRNKLQVSWKDIKEIVSWLLTAYWKITTEYCFQDMEPNIDFCSGFMGLEVSSVDVWLQFGYEIILWSPLTIVFTQDEFVNFLFVV